MTNVAHNRGFLTRSEKFRVKILAQLRIFRQNTFSDRILLDVLSLLCFLKRLLMP